VVNAILLAAVGAIILYIFFSWWHSTRDHEGNHWPINLAGFPTVHVHKETANEAAAEAIANVLRMTYREAWAVFAAFYEVGWDPTDKKYQAPIAKIGLNTGEEIEPKHPHIRWVLPDVLQIRFQSSMYYHFTGELHNMFRWNIHKCNMEIVKRPIPGEDAERAVKVQRWIEAKYGR